MTDRVREALEAFVATTAGSYEHWLLWRIAEVRKKALAALASEPGVSEEGLVEAAKHLVKIVERKAWDGLRSNGRAKDAGFEPFHHSEWTWGINGNARQQDYIDVVAEIVRLALSRQQPATETKFCIYEARSRNGGIGCETYCQTHGWNCPNSRGIKR